MFIGFGSPLACLSIKYLLYRFKHRSPQKGINKSTLTENLTTLKSQLNVYCSEDKREVKKLPQDRFKGKRKSIPLHYITVASINNSLESQNISDKDMFILHFF